MFETMRDELIYLERAFREIMVTKPMSDEDNTVFQWALDSIDYILKSQNWLDDKWVRLGFQNIDNAKALLSEMSKENNSPYDYYHGHARERSREVGGNHSAVRSLLTEGEQKKAEHCETIGRKATGDHKST